MFYGLEQGIGPAGGRTWDDAPGNTRSESSEQEYLDYFSTGYIGVTTG